jgi:hypothetical protein
MIVYAPKKEGVGRAAQLADDEAWRRQRELRQATDRDVERRTRLIEVADGDVDRFSRVDVVVLGYVDLRDSARTETENGGEVVLLPDWREWSIPMVNVKPGCRGQGCEGRVLGSCREPVVGEHPPRLAPSRPAITAICVGLWRGRRDVGRPVQPSRRAGCVGQRVAAVER